MNIAPDIECPHCGWVIVCPHGSSYGHAADTRTGSGTFLERVKERKMREAAPHDWSDFEFKNRRPEWTDNFLENMRRIPPEMRPIAEYFGRIPGRKGERATPHAGPARIAQPGGNPGYVKAAIEGER